jgi:hypothetical protein
MAAKFFNRFLWLQGNRFMIVESVKSRELMLQVWICLCCSLGTTLLLRFRSLTHQIKQIVWELFIKSKTAPERRFHRRRNFTFYVDTINIKWESGERALLKLKLCQHLFAFSWLARRIGWRKGNWELDGVEVGELEKGVRSGFWAVLFNLWAARH